MGLSHHWRRKTELPAEHFASAAADCRRLLIGVADLAGFDGTGDPIFTKERIVFNGRGARSCEPFEVAATEFDRHGRPEFFRHCKTEHLPYDLYVKAALVVLSHHLGDQLLVSSDESDKNWEEARLLVQTGLGYGADFALARDV